MANPGNGSAVVIVMEIVVTNQMLSPSSKTLMRNDMRNARVGQREN